MADEPDPIAEKLKAAVSPAQDREAAKSGERLLKADFESIAIQRAPEELKTLDVLLRDRAAKINQQRPPQIPEMRLVEVNHRLEAGKFAIELRPTAGMRDYSLRVVVGLHPNAQQFMAELPDVQSSIRFYSACADEVGFFWVNSQTGARTAGEQIVTDALEGLSDLLAADHRGDL
jgi:hypothetical protein